MINIELWKDLRVNQSVSSN